MLANLTSKTLVRGSDIIGQVVIVRGSGAEVGHVEDIIFDRISNQIVAMMVEKGESRILPWGGIYSIRENAVVATSEGMIMKAAELLDSSRIVELGKTVIGKQLMSTDERKLGKVVDMYFNAHSGKIIGYEITGGILADAVSDRYFAPAAQIVRFGDGGVFVSPASAKMFEEQVGSLQQSIWGEWQSLLESFEAAMNITHKKAPLGERLREAPSYSQNSMAELTAQVRRQLKQILAERVVWQAQGHPAQTAVLTDDNEFVVVAGQVVSEDVIEDARSHHKEVELMESVGLDFEKILNDNAVYLQKMVNRYADEWRSDGGAIVDSLRETATSLADDVKTRF